MSKDIKLLKYQQKTNRARFKDMKKVLVIAQNEVKANEGAAFFNGLTVRKVYPGAKRFPRHFEAVIVYYTDLKEINFIKDEIHRYQDAPIKVFFGNVHFDKAASQHAKSFAQGELESLKSYLSQQYQQLCEVIAKVFKTFDKDGSGFIDRNELGQVAAELGRPLDAAELEECIQDLDTNKDNQISQDEFKKWWLSGRQGLSSLMRRLLALKLKTARFFDNISGSLQEVIQEAADQPVDINSSQLRISINQVKEAGFSIYNKFLILSNEAAEEHNKVKANHNFQGVDSWILNLGLAIKNGKAEEVQGLLQIFFEESGFNASVVTEGPHKVLIGPYWITITHGAQNVVPLDDATVELIQQGLKVNQDVEVSIRLAASPQSILESGESALKLLLEGIEFELRLNVWRKISTVLMRVIEQGELDASVLPLFGGLAPAFLLKLKGDLQIDVDENMKETIFSNPIIEPLLMDALTLIHAIGGCNSDEQEEFEEHLNSRVLPLSQLQSEHSTEKWETEITYSVTQPRIGLTGRINGHGLGLLLRHGIKLLK
uniref:EF-hand domain-containing protein n=1 Tax=Sterkiella nova TaxID=200597 RepID=Q9U4D6_STENO|nr:unknown protein [Sterkiella nova]